MFDIEQRAPSIDDSCGSATVIAGRWRRGGFLRGVAAMCPLCWPPRFVRPRPGVLCIL